MQRRAKARARAYTRVTALATEPAIRARATRVTALARRRVIVPATTHATEHAKNRRAMGQLAMDRRAKGQLAMSTRAIRRVITRARTLVSRRVITLAIRRAIRRATERHANVRVMRPVTVQRAREPVTTEPAKEQLAQCPHALSVRVPGQLVLGLPPAMERVMVLLVPSQRGMCARASARRATGCPVLTLRAMPSIADSQLSKVRHAISQRVMDQHVVDQPAKAGHAFSLIARNGISAMHQICRCHHLTT